MIGSRSGWLCLIGGLFAMISTVLARSCYAEDVYMGAVVSTGPVLGKSSGSYLDVSGYGGLAAWLFLGAETKKINDQRLNAVYTGVGFTGLLQAHVGSSNHGGIYRVKSEFAPFALRDYDLFYPKSSFSNSSLSRLSVSLTYENTFKGQGLSNFTVGLGYVFN